MLAIPTTAGPVYFKETAPTMADDAALTTLLSRVSPALICHPIAVDGRRMLLPDAGPRLREELERTRDIASWERILAAYADLQRSAAKHVDDLLAAGALDRRLERLPALLAELAADPGVDLGAQETERLLALGPRVTAACAELLAIGAESIQHDDLHDANVHLAGDGFRILDWGDACVGHPFGTLLVTLRSVAFRFEIPEDAPQLDRLRAAYLEPWRDLGSEARLQRAADLATWLGLLGRALTWRDALIHADEEELSEWASAVPNALRMLIEREPH